ncbi:MAG: hypothetical protein IJF94_01840 [Eubacterium sp.]|nr:hypothetical protein [Eubacterium sp.]
MLKDAIDTVKDAEQKAAEIVRQAEADAEQQKKDVEQEAVDNKQKAVEFAQAKEQEAMDALISESKSIDAENSKKIGEKVNTLKDKAEKREAEVVESLIDYIAK